ncbi:MAG: hypothetical protein ABIJ96_13215 [Elusimicrobiota bacterium]
MQHLSAVVLLTGALIPSLAWSAPPDMKPVDRATAIMGECTKMLEAAASMKVPDGFSRAKAAAFINAQLEGGAAQAMAGLDPAHDQFLKKVEARKLQLEECGKKYRAAMQESSAVTSKLEGIQLSEQEAAVVGAAMDKHQAALEKLETVMEKVTDAAGVQVNAQEVLQKYFLNDPAAPETKAAAPEAEAKIDPELKKQLLEILAKEKDQKVKLAEQAKTEAVKTQQAMRALQDREKSKAARAQAEKLELVKARAEKMEWRKKRKMFPMEKPKGKALAAPMAKAGAAPAPQAAAAPAPEADPLSESDTNKVLNWIAGKVSSARQPFCYRDSFGRGVGVPVNSCSSDQEKDGWLCYPKCKQNYDGVGPVCWQHCPSGYIDMGAVCHINKPLTKSGSWPCAWKLFGKCMARKHTCPSGYVNAGLFCALKTPSTPAGYKGTGLDPMKGSYGRGVGEPMHCSSSQQYDAGLCYTPCKSGYHGVGPVCWMGCPSSKTECGVGCANSTISCVTSTADMVISPLMMAYNCATFGSASTMKASYKAILNGCIAAKNGAAVGYQLGSTIGLWVTDAVANFDQLTTPEIKAALAKGCKGHPRAEQFIKEQYALQNLNLMLEKDGIQTAKNTLAAASNFDPTGISGVVSAYANPICSHTEPFPSVKFLD